MKKSIVIIFIILTMYGMVNAQNPMLDSIRHELAITTNDTLKVNLLNRISGYYNQFPKRRSSCNEKFSAG